MPKNQEWWQAADSNQQTADSNQQTADSKQQTAKEQGHLEAVDCLLSAVCC
jgi:hypothetical protein